MNRICPAKAEFISSLEEVVPKQWRQANVTPIFKKAKNLKLLITDLFL